MRRIIMLLFVSITTLTINAQTKGFICTGNNVNIRTGPGKNYPVACFIGSDEKCQLQKGYAVKYLGKQRNGFYYIDADLTGGWGLQPPKGWICALVKNP